MSEASNKEAALENLMDVTFNQPAREPDAEFDKLCDDGIAIFERVNALGDGLVAQRINLAALLQRFGDSQCDPKIKQAMHAVTRMALVQLDKAIAELGAQ